MVSSISFCVYLDRDAAGNLIRKAGVMGVALAGSDVQAGDRV
jgi:hypothetical protein